MTTVNTRVSLWPDRWPAIAHHVLADGRTCVQTVEEAPPDEQAQVKWALPCADCEKNTACLNAKRKELGPLLYDREELTRPRSSESSLFPYELFEPCLRKEESLVPYWHKPFSIEHRYGIASAWDLAWSEKIGGDYMVKMTGYVDRQTGTRKILDIWRGNRLSFEEQVDKIVDEWGRFQDDVVVLESDAAQAIWAQYIGDTTAVPTLPHSAGGKADLAMGVPGLILSLEQGRWEIPYAVGSYHHENAEIFLAEAEAFGWVDGKLQGVGEHDDTVMAWWHLSWALDRLAGTTPGRHRAGVQPGRQI